MSSSLRRLYQSLPLVHDLRSVRSAVGGLNRHHRLMETAAITQALAAIKASDERYRDPRRLLVHGAQYWSQNYEDGMIAEIFRRIGTTTKTFLEIGVGNGSENNTMTLLASGWNGWWIEGDQDSCDAITKRFDLYPAPASRLTLRQSFVSPENIAGLLHELQVPTEVDLFSLDIDLDTFHIWAALKDFRPRVIVVEYNGGFPADVGWIHPYQPGKTWDYSQAFGASLKAFETLGSERGYRLVGCDLIGINAFFVREDLVADHFAAPFTAENHYEPPRYGLYFRWGHQSAFYG
jgi:hypothetical protein